MTTDTLALLISGLSFCGTVFNVWLKLQLRADMGEMKDSILARIEQKHPTRELVDERHKDIVGRVEKLEQRWT